MSKNSTLSRRGPRAGNLKSQPAAQEHRDALNFEAVAINWTWDNHDWNDTIPDIRLAIGLLGKDRRQLKDAMDGIVKAGLAPTMLDNWSALAKHLKGMQGILDAALLRSFLVLEEMGFSPDKPPPDTRVAAPDTVN